MVFYRVEGVAKSIIGIGCLEGEQSINEIMAASRHLGIKSESFNLGIGESAYVFISEITHAIVTVGAIVSTDQDISVLSELFFDSVGIVLDEITYKETTYGNLRNMLLSAERCDFISDEDDALRKFGLSYLNDRFGYGIDFEEYIIEEKLKKSVYASAKAIVSNEAMICELDRIYEGKKGKGHISGHPVHYMIQTDDRKTADEMNRVLLQALYANKRLKHKRSCSLDIRIGRKGPAKRSYDCLYKSCSGGAVQVLFAPECDERDEDGFASAQREYLEAICEAIRRYRNEVLTIFCIPSRSRKTDRILREYLDSMTFIEIKETAVSKERALEYLKDVAKAHGVRIDKQLKGMFTYEDGYYAGDLQRIFDEWFDTKLKRNLYPQYSQMEIYRKNDSMRKASGVAYDDLMEMPGIDEAKKMINMALDCRKAQKLFSGAGVGEERFSMHMVFTGNPGTAKTSVARLFARILKENDLVDTGAFIEAGRGDLVGKYVGWTAKIIQKKFKDAVGGVLFIDEAYSLLDDRNGSFGDEAINTIVQELENHREDVITIFAGYPEQMDEFMERNPGLRSRIAFHVDFPDYDPSELCDIAALTARKMGLEMSGEAIHKLYGVFDVARMNDNFGNGRFVRNVVERARMKQLKRLLENGLDAIARDSINTIEACDIEIPMIKEKEQVRIGFCG